MGPPRPSQHADQQLAPRKASVAVAVACHITIVALGAPGQWREHGVLWLVLRGRIPRLGREQRTMHPTLGPELAHLLHLEPDAPASELQEAVAAGKTAEHARFGAGPGPQVGGGAFDQVDLTGRGKNLCRRPGNQHQRQSQRRRHENFNEDILESLHG